MAGNKALTPSEKITKIVETWFLKEPLLFGTYCTHKLKANTKMSIPFRSGKMKIEYNPDLISDFTESQIEDYLRVEVVRIILKHPYQRMPACPNLVVLAYASDITIQDNLKVSVPLKSAEEFNLPKNLCYEEYYAKLLEQQRQTLSDFSEILSDLKGESEKDDSTGIDSDEDNSNESDDSSNSEKNSSQSQNETNPLKNEKFQKMFNAYQTAELWSEDNEAVEIINAEIEKAQASNSWGTISGNLQQLIEASLIIQMDYRRMLCMFRASIISSQRKLTRMRPNRRYGFSYMGSQNDFTTGLLVAVDVSGSITDESLQQFFSIVNRFFKYGIKTIDVIQFDAEMKEGVVSLKKAKKTVKIIGRGGTDFQPAIDYYEQHPMYDGLIMFTDGYAEIPKLHRYAERILWVLTSKSEYDDFCAKILDNLPGSKATYIP